MDSPCKPPPWRRRRLCDLLQDQQEPFLPTAHQHHRSNINNALGCGCFRFDGRARPRGTLRRALKRLSRWKLLQRMLRGTPENPRPILLGCFGREGLAAINFERFVSRKDDPSQLSPVSVLDIHSDLDSATRTQSTGENPSTSSHDGSSADGYEAEELLDYCYSPPLPSDMLLLECVKEMQVEERIWEQGRKSWVGGGSRPMGIDYLSSNREWNDFQCEIQEFVREIESAIFQELRDEAVTDMLQY